jgi:DNA-binding IclR family transcriptional regulator
MNVTTPLESILPLQPPTARLILSCLGHKRVPMTLVSLCVATGSTPGTLERVVRQLTKDGYLIRTANGASPLFYLSAAIQ